MNLIMPEQNYVKKGYWKNKNIFNYLQDAYLSCPECIAVDDSYVTYKYKELYNKSVSLASTLRSMGVKKGDVVSFQLPNWSESLIIHYAVAMIGAVCNPIIPIYRKREVKYILHQSKTKIIFLPNKFRDFDYLKMIRELQDELDGLQKIVILDKYADQPSINDDIEMFFEDCIMPEVSSQFDAESVNEKDPLLLMFTSGTTSNPKGVVHTHNTLIHENETIISLYQLGENDHVFMPSPITHIAGFIAGLELPVIIKSKLVLQDIWKPKEAVEIIIKENCTFLLGATPFVQGIYDVVKETEQQVPLKMILSGGADVPPELVINSSKLLNCYVSRVYGSTEYPTLTLCGPEDSFDKTAYTDGRLLEGSEAIILDDNMREVPANQVGELAVKGPEMFLGYLQPEFNETAFYGDYFLTGDLASMDQDGYIKIIGRKKDIIIRGGENISVKEVEELLYRHDSVNQVAVVAMPDKKMGEKACAFIKLNKNKKLDLETMKEYLLGKGLAIQKVPERLEIIDEMPMTTSGKIQKFVLREDIQKMLEKQ
ncbi:AMP-binding protein [Desertibacillus haloalkaliphilus]|uniref:AMP-binding protein n=1 Tax=Desertibacillus haloalkaliphilus TaxID=1328930 RepID=UPI001C263486|nr:AMP-binding protein [Desertibacillus haloalkaliphilus]MBU8906129.1 AMP-binding protein [Desertibacillus haloalkaliphilus]